jgi:crotonobetainyl-CoA:carnitine CoA-transferase CaiB-like acyl-CoA transferase
MMPKSLPGTTDAPLAGLTVIDLGQVYQGPYAGLLLAKAGANVIKVEPPHGEPARLRSAPGKTTSLPMAMLNANKRGITLNLKTERGQELLRELVLRSDVLLENFAPGVMERLHIGFADLHKLNSRLVYASGSGYGLSGPDCDSLAMDLTVQASSGAMSITGFPDGPPLRAGPAFVDFASGTHLYAAILTALYERHRTGVGRLVEVSMQETVYPMLASNLGIHYNSGGKEIPPRTGNMHGGLAIAPHNVYPTNDGHVALECLVEMHWKQLLHGMGREDLEHDERFTTNASRLKNQEATDAVVTSWTSLHSKAEICEATRRLRIPCAPVRDVVEVMHDPHMHQRGALEWIEHPELGRVVVPASPLRLHGAPEVPTRPSPALGQHNLEIYGGWLGLDDAELANLHRSGVI